MSDRETKEAITGVMLCLSIVVRELDKSKNLDKQQVIESLEAHIEESKASKPDWTILPQTLYLLRHLLLDDSPLLKPDQDIQGKKQYPKWLKVIDGGKS